MLPKSTESDIHLSAFNWQGALTRHLQGKLTGDVYEVQAIDLELIEPQIGAFRSESHCLISLALNRLTEVRGAYVQPSLGHATEKFSPLIFVPAKTNLHWTWEPGAQQVVSCMFEIQKIGALAGLEWGWANIDLLDTLKFQNSEIATLMKTIFAEMQSPGFASELKIEGILTLIALELRRKFFPSARQDNFANGKLSRKQFDTIRGMIEVTPDAELSLAVLASACDLSPQQLSLSFKKTIGVTLRQYVANARVKKARALLTDPNIMIKQVGYKCGFQTAAAFSSAFHKATGMSPQQYRDKRSV